MKTATATVGRLPFGHTNATRIDGRTVVKRYLGPDAGARALREANALRFLVGRMPVPKLLRQEPEQVSTTLIDGEPGQSLIDAYPGDVLYEVGRLARTLHRLDLHGHFGAQHRRSVLVHGDFGPQNVLFSHKTANPSAIVDWEYAHIGDPVEDLAWAEWTVRSHHPEVVGSLSALFDGYGRRPPFPQRRQAMIDTCARELDFVRRWPGADPDAVDLWQRRLKATAAFRE